jgi:hypothetical protein
MKMLSTTKFYNFSTSITFILVIYFGYKLYERYVRFMNNVSTTLLDEQMTKIKVIDLDQFYDFYVHDFFSWNHLMFQNDIWSYHFLKLKFQIDKTQSHKKMIKIIAVRTQ